MSERESYLHSHIAEASDRNQVYKSHNHTSLSSTLLLYLSASQSSTCTPLQDQLTISIQGCFTSAQAQKLTQPALVIIELLCVGEKERVCANERKKERACGNLTDRQVTGGISKPVLPFYREREWELKANTQGQEVKADTKKVRADNNESHQQRLHGIQTVHTITVFPHLHLYSA